MDANSGNENVNDSKLVFLWTKERIYEADEEL